MKSCEARASVGLRLDHLRPGPLRHGPPGATLPVRCHLRRRLRVVLGARNISQRYVRVGGNRMEEGATHAAVAEALCHFSGVFDGAPVRLRVAALQRVQGTGCVQTAKNVRRHRRVDVHRDPLRQVVLSRGEVTAIDA